MVAKPRPRVKADCTKQYICRGLSVTNPPVTHADQPKNFLTRRCQKVHNFVGATRRVARLIPPPCEAGRAAEGVGGGDFYPTISRRLTSSMPNSVKIILPTILNARISGRLLVVM